MDRLIIYPGIVIFSKHSAQLSFIVNIAPNPVVLAQNTMVHSAYTELGGGFRV